MSPQTWKCVGSTGFESLLSLCPDRVSMYCYFHCYSRNADRTRGWERGFAVYKESPASTGLFLVPKTKFSVGLFSKGLQFPKAAPLVACRSKRNPLDRRALRRGLNLQNDPADRFAKRGRPAREGAPLVPASTDYPSSEQEGTAYLQSVMAKVCCRLSASQSFIKGFDLYACPAGRHFCTAKSAQKRFRAAP